MSLPNTAVLHALKNAGASMANRHTPFVYNEWYVAAFATEVSRDFLPRRLLGKRVVLFRTESGEPVALSDRCAHRAYPLSLGTLEGDTIVCGYHGFRFDVQGNCVEVPSASKCPKGIGVARYPVVEKGPLVWIWMGDPDAADTALLPEQDWLSSPAWKHSQGSFHLNANYVSMHENLLDLTHLSYLHANTFGTPDYARAAFRSEIREGYFALHRDVVPTTLPPVWAKPTQLEGCTTAARIVKSEFKSPAFHQVNVTFYDSALPPDARTVSRISTAHLLTPETHGSCHYFIVHGRDFALAEDDVTAFMHEQLFKAFQEDVDGMSALEQVWETTDEEDMYEMSVASDGPSVAMRRYLKARAEKEAAVRASALHGVRDARVSAAASVPLADAVVPV